MAVNTVEQAKQEMKKALEHLHDELKKIRTGRANASVLESVKVEVYGQLMPINHVGNVVALDAVTLQITPFDPNNLDAISTAISKSDLGLNPSDDGRVVRVSVPPLTEERRQELVKQLGTKVEAARVALRNIRHELLKANKKLQKAGEISEDDYSRLEKQIDELISEFNEEITQAFAKKEEEILKV